MLDSTTSRTLQQDPTKGNLRRYYRIRHDNQTSKQLRAFQGRSQRPLLRLGGSEYYHFSVNKYRESPPGHFPTNRTVSIHNRQTRRTLQHHLLVRIGRYGHQTNGKPNTGKPPQVAGNKQLHNTSWRGEGQDQRTSSANLSHMRLKSLGHSPSDNNPLRAKMLFTGRLVTVKPIEVEENGTPAEQKRTRLRSALDCIPDSC